MIPTSEVISYIRFWLGNLPESVISDEDMAQIIAIVRLQYPSATDCQLLYYSALAILSWLIRKDSQGSSGTTGTGEVKRLEESRGKTKIVKEWNVGTSGGTTGSWDSILEDLLANPDSIGCPVFSVDPDSGTAGGMVTINVSKDRFDTGTPWRQNLLSPKKKSWYDV